MIFLELFREYNDRPHRGLVYLNSQVFENTDPGFDEAFRILKD
jgi:hypothetical protein